MSEVIESVVIDEEDRETPIRLRRQEMPRSLTWIESPEPGILRNVSPDLDEGVTMKVQFIDNKRSRQQVQNLGATGLRVISAPIDQTAFARLLAKIAHAFAIAELGISGFSHWLLPLILGQPASRMYLVGGFSPQQGQASEPVSLHRVVSNGKLLVVAHISLHVFRHLPKYQVVVGSASEA